MALSNNLELTSGPAIVQAPGFVTPLLTTQTAMRGTAPVSVQVLNNKVAANLPAGAVLFYGLKLASAMKGPWLALAQLTAVDTVNSPGLWTGSLALNNAAMRAAMHADVDDPLPEVMNLPCLAEIYYTLPAVNGVTPDPVGSINFNFSVGAPLVNDTENIAPDPNTPFPSAAALTTAVAQAAAAEPGLGVPPSDHSILLSLVNKTRSWLATSTWGRTLLGFTNAAAFYAANPPPGGSVPLTPGVAYLRTNGNDGTAVIGDPSKPYATAQAVGDAANAAAVATGSPVVIDYIGTFNGWTATLDGSGNAASWNSSVSLRGAGWTASYFGGINCNGGNGTDGTAQDDGSGTGTTVTATYPTNGGNGGSIELTATTCNLGPLTANGGQGGAAPALQYQGSPDYNSSDYAPNGNGGYPGTVYLILDQTTECSISAVGGSAGSNHDGSGGAPSSGGSVYVQNGQVDSISVAAGAQVSSDGGTAPQGSITLDQCTVASGGLSGDGSSGTLNATRSRLVGASFATCGFGSINADASNATS